MTLHPYATNLQERRSIPLFIALAAFASALLLGEIIEALRISPPAWLDVPSTAGFYGLLYEWFRRRLWLGRYLRALGLIKTPDITGQWEGYVATSFDEHKGQHPVKLTVVQNWTDILIQLTGTSSHSHSTIGSMIVGQPTVITYEYYNEPSPGAVSSMHAHRGTTRLRLSSDGTELAGEYYSGRDRQNYGSIYLRKQQIKSDCCAPVAARETSTVHTAT